MGSLAVKYSPNVHKSSLMPATVTGPLIPFLLEGNCPFSDRAQGELKGGGEVISGSNSREVIPGTPYLFLPVWASVRRQAAR
jgi:hypothetical protein